MGLFIRTWLINQLGIPVPDPDKATPEQLRTSFSNGFIFGEILRKYGVISDDQLTFLSNHFTEKTRIKNMRYIHRWMCEAGLCFPFTDLLDIIQEKEGVLTRFLYTLYFSLEGKYGSNISQIEEKKPHDYQAFLQHLEQVDLADSVVEVRSQLHEMATYYKDGRGQVQVQAQFLENEVEDEGEEEEEALPSAPDLPVDSETAVALKLQQLCPSTPTPVSATAANKHDIAEAAKLYFAQEAWNAEKLRVQSQGLRFRSERDASGQDQDEEIDRKSVIDLLMLLQEKGKGQGDHLTPTERRLLQEMEEFDAIQNSILDAFEEDLQTKKSNETDTNSTKKDSSSPKNPAALAVPILRNPTAAQVGLTNLKKMRKEDAILCQKRTTLRKHLTSKLLKRVEVQIHDDLVDTLMAKCSKIYGKERILADFLEDQYQIKRNFLSHVLLEQNELAKIRMEQDSLLANDLRKQAEVDSLINSLGEQRNARIDDEKAEKEMALLLKIISNQLTLIMRLAFRIGDYRIANQGEEPTAEMIEDWKHWLLLGLDTPVHSDTDSEDTLDFDLNDGNCFIVLSETPIPNELHPTHIPAHEPGILHRASQAVRKATLKLEKRQSRARLLEMEEEMGDGEDTDAEYNDSTTN